MASMLALRAGAEREGTGIEREKERDASDKQREATGADRKTLIAECQGMSASTRDHHMAVW